jgi:acetyl coenzyme A synthetase (ADP forming)-like protein
MAADHPAQPAVREVDVALRDGSTVHVRPACPADEPAVLEFLRGLSAESRAFRFFSAAANLEAAARWAVNADGRDIYGLLATTGASGRIIGHGGYEREAPGRAEVAFAIADDFQHRGLGTILLAHLAAAAQAQGIDVFTASVLPQNHKMIEVFRESGFPVALRSAPDAIGVELPTSPSAEAARRFERRDQTAAAAAVRSFLAPRAVAVVGASRRRGTVGGELLHNIVANGYTGVVYPVNAHADVVQAIPAYPSVRETPGPVDLAVIAIPAAHVLDAARDCAAAGVHSLVVVSAGFAESDQAGAQRQQELLEICRSAGMRLVGPNCLGVVNTAPEVQLDATFAPRQPAPGRVGFLSQSGGLGIAIIDATNALGMGLSSFVSIGNKADISGNDLLQFWESDEGTDVVLLYLESFGNVRKFARLARRIGASKPIAAVKSGRSAAGARATSSHTGALLAASDVTVDALFRQAGVIRTDTLAELFDVAAVLSSQPVPAGNRVAIVTNAGGPGILCADACETSGLEVASFSDALRERLGFLPREAATANPVDMIATASAEDYRRTIEAVGDSGEVDAVIVIFIQPLVTEATAVAIAIRDAADALVGRVPIVAVFMTAGEPPGELLREPVHVPAFAFPEDAARALGHAVRYGRWRAEPEGEVPELDDVQRDEAAALVASALAAGAGWLAPESVEGLLRCYGLPLVESRYAAAPAEAASLAEQLGGPVALKAAGPGLVHKTDAGAVRLDLRGVNEVRGAAQRMAEGLASAGVPVDRFVVQPMAPPGVELLVGVVHDPSFGPVIACGAGGTAAELINDVAVRITPLTERNAHQMLRSLATFPLLDGYRGAPRCDTAAIEDLLLRVSALVETHPEVAEMDCNPVVATPQGALIVDARVRIERVQPPRPVPSLEV